MYFPNRESAVYLKCKCIICGWGTIHTLGSIDVNYCEDHGWQKVLRKATIQDQLKWIRAHPLDSYTRSIRYQKETLF